MHGTLIWYGYEPARAPEERMGFERQTPAPFCQTARCATRADHEVDGLYGPAAKVSFRGAGNTDYCPACGYAVFWSSFYKKR